MEKRITNKVSQYIEIFKTDIKNKLEDDKELNYDFKSDFLKFIYDYESLNLNKEDFVKRRRIKSMVPSYMRCMAKRANGEQCTRKKRDGTCYCGTHEKSRPHGEIDNDKEEVKYKKVEIWLQEINGILYYIDSNNNIYKTEDIISNQINPSIHAKYNIVDGNYVFVNN